MNETKEILEADWVAIRFELMRLQTLEKEVIEIAETNLLPNGDGVNGPTFEWAEEWARKWASPLAHLCGEKPQSATAADTPDTGTGDAGTGAPALPPRDSPKTITRLANDARPAGLYVGKVQYVRAGGNAGLAWYVAPDYESCEYGYQPNEGDRLYAVTPTQK